MDFLKQSIIFFLLTIALSLTFGCAKDFEKTISEPSAIEKETKQELGTLPGKFKLSNGQEQSLNNGDTRPILLFFISETCTSCREETEILAKHFAEFGLPNKIQILSVLIGSFPADIEPWKNTFNETIDWTLGADLDLELYKNFFTQLVTPSILYFDPSTKILKRWQSKLSITELKKETIPWY